MHMRVYNSLAFYHLPFFFVIITSILKNKERKKRFLPLELLHLIVEKHPFQEDVLRIDLLSLQFAILQVILLYHLTFQDLAMLAVQLIDIYQNNY